MVHKKLKKQYVKLYPNVRICARLDETHQKNEKTICPDKWAILCRIISLNNPHKKTV